MTFADVHSLTDVAKRVISGLLHWPEEMDREIAYRMGINPSTFSSVKRPLREKGFYRLVTVPNLWALGAGGLVVSYDRFTTTGSATWKVPQWSAFRSGSIISLPHTQRDWFVISVVRGLDDFMSLQRRLALEREGAGLGHGDTVHVLFPFESSEVRRFFYYAPAVDSVLGVGPPAGYPSGPPVLFSPPGERALRESEKLVLYTIIRHPSEYGGLIAHRIRMSQPSVSNIRRRLKADQILRYEVAPNMSLMGFKYLCMTHVAFKQHVSLSDRRDGPNIAEWDQVATALLADMDEVYISFHTTFEAVRTIAQAAMGAYAHLGILKTEPRVIVLPLSEVDLGRISIYHNAIRELIGVRAPIAREVESILTDALQTVGMVLIREHLEAMGVDEEDLGPDEVEELADRLDISLHTVLPRSIASDLVARIREVGRKRS